MKQALIIGLVLLACSVIAGCTTSYHSYNFLTYGYTDKEATPGVTEVSFTSSPRTGSQKTYLFAMKRAAEVTRDKGYNYFEILSKKSFLMPQTVYAGGVAYTIELPKTVLKIRFRKTKTATAYNANKVFGQVEKH